MEHARSVSFLVTLSLDRIARKPRANCSSKNPFLVGQERERTPHEGGLVSAARGGRLFCPSRIILRPSHRKRTRHGRSFAESRYKRDGCSTCVPFALFPPLSFACPPSSQRDATARTRASALCPVIDIDHSWTSLECILIVINVRIKLPLGFTENDESKIGESRERMIRVPFRSMRVEEKHVRTVIKLH